MRLVAEMWTLLVTHISSLFWYELICQIGINKQPMRQTLKKPKESVETTAVTNAQLLPHTARVSSTEQRCARASTEQRCAWAVQRLVSLHHLPRVTSICYGLFCFPFPLQSPAQDTKTAAFLLLSVTQSCMTLCDPMDCSTPGFSVLQNLLELAQTRVHWVRYAIQPSHPVLPFSSCIQSFQPQGLF